MVLVSFVTALVSLALIGHVAWGGGLPTPVPVNDLLSGFEAYYVPVSGLILAVIVWQSRRISTFLKVFVVMMALGYLYIVGTTYLNGVDLMPESLAPLLAPPFMAAATVGLAALIYAVSFIPVIRTITQIVDPHFEARDAVGNDFGWLGRPFSSRGAAVRALLGFIIFENFLQVAMQVRLSIWYRDLFNALQQKDAAAFWVQIWGIFVPLLVAWIIVQMIDLTADRFMQIRWRNWLSQRYFNRWLDGGTHYRMQILGLSTDNPDQRIADDVDSFVAQTMSLSVGLLSQLVTVVSFTVILWGISKDFVFPGTDYVVPGFLVWVVIAYAFIGTWLTHLIGRPLIRLDFLQQRVEANFRFALARLREYSEQVALLSGAKAEEQRLRDRFGDIVSNYIAILVRRLKLIGFTFSWSQISVAFPYILTGSYYFAGKITLGQVQQASQSFRQLNDAMSYFISAYTTLASYKAVIDRLTTFGDNMAKAQAIQPDAVPAPVASSDDVGIKGLTLKLPDDRIIASVPEFTFRKGERTLLTGPSGSGKSTLFRALAGVWPFATGAISVPEGKSVLLLPQQPYIPQGTLRGAVAYPEPVTAFSDADIRAALAAVKLDHVIPHLDEEALWAQTLSGGEKQRLAIAHALLAKPDWLFLDEATAALDEPLEAEVYRVIAEKLPETTVVSIGHRTTLIDLHRRQVALRPGADGVSVPQDVTLAPAQ